VFCSSLLLCYVHLFYNNIHKTKKEIKYKAQQKKGKMPHLIYKTIIVEDGEETKEEDANKVMNNDVTRPPKLPLIIVCIAFAEEFLESIVRCLLPSRDLPEFPKSIV